MKHLHRSQMTMAERDRARDHDNGVDLAGRFVRAGGTLQAEESERDQAMKRKWNDAPLAGHQTFTLGPRFDELLADTNVESESAGLHTLGRRP